MKINIERVVTILQCFGMNTKGLFKLAHENKQYLNNYAMVLEYPINVLPMQNKS